MTFEEDWRTQDRCQICDCRLSARTGRCPACNPQRVAGLAEEIRRELEQEVKEDA